MKLKITKLPTGVYELKYSYTYAGVGTIPMPKVVTDYYADLFALFVEIKNLLNEESNGSKNFQDVFQWEKEEN